MSPFGRFLLSAGVFANAAGLLTITDLPAGASPADVRRATRVESLPDFGALTDVNLYSAYVTVQPSAKAAIHFELFEADKLDAPVVVYLMGGPGVPGFAGWGIMQNMPLRMDTVAPKLVGNDASNSWTGLAHVLWLDAPIHVGYSVADPNFFVNCSLCPNTGNDYARHALSAVSQVLNRFGLADNDLHIAGLSYGGKYVPALAWTIIHFDSQLARRLHSVIIFGSWTDPESQLVGQVSHFVTSGLISAAGADPLLAMETKELSLLKSGQFRKTNELNANLTAELLARTGVAPVDVTMPINVLGNAMQMITTVANGVDFKKAMHVEEAGAWEIHDNDGPVADALGDEVMRSFLPRLAELMQHREIEVVLVSGQFDSVVRAARVEAMLDRTAFDAGVPEWASAPRKPWPEVSANGGASVKGSLRQAGNLRFYYMLGEGHIAGLRRPEAARQIMSEVLGRSRNSEASFTELML